MYMQYTHTTLVLGEHSLNVSLNQWCFSYTGITKNYNFQISVKEIIKILQVIGLH